MTMNPGETRPAPHYSTIADFERAVAFQHDAPRGLYRTVGKRALDITLILLALPILVLIMVPATLLVASDGHSPFYTQLRVGRHGKLYRIWKFRSMVVNADAALEAHLAANPGARAEWDKTQKLKNDPRITRVGRIMRKCSIDELPQLWNVLKGDMSLVGPRPMMVCQRDLYPGTRYYNLRPGITGLWQVSARNETSFSQRAHYDGLYDRCLSLKTDLKLLFATIAVVASGTGY